jgi:glycosyltransferase involved in cell wall biosynthesis
MISKYKQEDIANHVKLFNKWLYKDPLPLDTSMEALYRQGAPAILDFKRHLKKVVIWCGPAWEHWNHITVSKGMGGSETWATYLAREFVKLGYLTTIYNDLLCEDGSGTVLDPVKDDSGKLIGNVVYRNHTNLLEDTKYDIIDYFIASRSTEPFNWNIHAMQRYVMVHDIWISGDPKYDIKAWAVQKFAYLSEWHKDFLIQHHNMPADKMFMTSNGIDLSLYSDVDSIPKKNMMVFSSSPDRGLYQLLKMFPIIRERVPDFELYVAYGWLNWETAAKSRNDQVSMDLIDKIKKMMLQPGVTYLGRISKTELAKYQKQAKVWLFSSWFQETQCITSIENGASKNAVLIPALAGLTTTMKDSAIFLNPEGLTRDNDYPPEFVNKFIDESVKLLTNEEYRKEWADKAYKKAITYTWDKIAADWVKHFNE